MTRKKVETAAAQGSGYYFLNNFFSFYNDILKIQHYLEGCVNVVYVNIFLLFSIFISLSHAHSQNHSLSLSGSNAHCTVVQRLYKYLVSIWQLLIGFLVFSHLLIVALTLPFFESCSILFLFLSMIYIVVLGLRSTD